MESPTSSIEEIRSELKAKDDQLKKLTETHLQLRATYQRFLDHVYPFCRTFNSAAGYSDGRSDITTRGTHSHPMSDGRIVTITPSSEDSPWRKSGPVHIIGKLTTSSVAHGASHSLADALMSSAAGLVSVPSAGGTSGLVDFMEAELKQAADNLLGPHNDEGVTRSES